MVSLLLSSDHILPGSLANIIDEKVTYTFLYSPHLLRSESTVSLQYVVFIQALSQPSCTYMRHFYIFLLFSKRVSLVAGKNADYIQACRSLYTYGIRSWLHLHSPLFPGKHTFFFSRLHLTVLKGAFFLPQSKGSIRIYRGIACLQMLADFTLFAQGSPE